MSSPWTTPVGVGGTPSGTAGDAGTATTTTTAAKMAEYWSDDYTPLQSAGRAVLQSLREEEQADDADLYRRLSTSGDGSHLYFPPDEFRGDASSSSSMGNDSSRGAGRTAAGGAAATANGAGRTAPPRTFAVPVTATVRHRETVPLPQALAHKLRNVRNHSFMGLLAPASLAWMSVDDTAYLWPFERPNSFWSFQVPSKQSVITVGLSRPKKGTLVTFECACVLCNAFLFLYYFPFADAVFVKFLYLLRSRSPSQEFSQNRSSGA